MVGCWPKLGATHKHRSQQLTPEIIETALEALQQTGTTPEAMTIKVVKSFIKFVTAREKATADLRDLGLLVRDINWLTLSQ